MRKLLTTRRLTSGVVVVSRSRLGGVGLAGAVSVLLVLGASASAARVDVSPATASSPLVPRSELVGGRDYGEWLAAAYKWRLSLPGVTADKTTSCITKSQHGPVWFLGLSPITGTCNLPSGIYLMLFTPTFDCSTVERPPLHATTNAGLRQCAKGLWARYPGAETVTLDGVRLRPPGYVVATAAFHFTMPERNNWLHVRGHTSGRAAVYGLAAILRPLSPGVHTLVQVVPPFANTSGSTETIKYRISVG